MHVMVCNIAFYVFSHFFADFDDYVVVNIINTKNCSLSIVLTATDQKPQKSLKR